MTVPQPTAPLPNLPLLRKILDHIDAHPEEWNQENFATETECGTAFCIAGHAVAMTEGIVVHPLVGTQPASGRTWSEAAAEALGIPDDYMVSDGDHLFSASNTRDDVQRVAEAIAARAGEEL